MKDDWVGNFWKWVAMAGPPGGVEATFKYRWIDSLQLMNFGKTYVYTCVRSMYAFLMDAASSSQVYCPHPD